MADTVFVTNGASNHSKGERQKDDYYSTSPEAVKMVVKELKKLYDTDNWEIWEPCCGEGHISKTLVELGLKVVRNSDLIDRGFGEGNVDFLKEQKMCGNVIFTNPPYKFYNKMLEHSIGLMAENNLCIFLGRIQALEGEARGKIFDKNPPEYVLIHRKRIGCYKNGIVTDQSSALCYAWLVFRKGFKGDPKVKWL